MTTGGIALAIRNPLRGSRSRTLPGLLLLLLVLATGCASASASTTPGGNAAAVTCGSDGTIPGWTTEQIGNARAIAQVALGLGLGQQGALVGITAAITESTLRSLNYGDYSSNGQMTTSRGLFQMKDAWGSLEDRLDPTKAATIFYTIDKGPGVRGLIHIPGWQQMTVPQAAQAVEGSQFSSGSNYAGNLAAATAITQAVTASCTTGPGSSASPPGMQQNDSQDPSTFGWVHGGQQEPLVYQGLNFGQVAKGTAKLWTAMLNELVPLIPGGLNNDLGCFEDRANVNNPTVLSFHAFGLACDLNSGVNCNGCAAQSLQGRQFALPMATHDVVAKWGFQWGGDFRGTPDPMHIELHVTPQQVAAATTTTP